MSPSAPTIGDWYRIYNDYIRYIDIRRKNSRQFGEDGCMHPLISRGEEFTEWYKFHPRTTAEQEKNLTDYWHVAHQHPNYSCGLTKNAWVLAMPTFVQKIHIDPESPFCRESPGSPLIGRICQWPGMPIP